MIRSIISTTVLLTGFLLFLSLEIGNKPIFSYLHTIVSPITRSAQNAAESFFSRSIDNTHDYTRKIFDNSVPKVKDSVKSKLSSQKKHQEPLEDISHKEKKELDGLIKRQK